MITWNEEKAREYFYDIMKNVYTKEEIDKMVDYLFKPVLERNEDGRLESK